MNVSLFLLVPKLSGTKSQETLNGCDISWLGGVWPHRQSMHLASTLPPTSTSFEATLQFRRFEAAIDHPYYWGASQSPTDTSVVMTTDALTFSDVFDVLLAYDVDVDVGIDTNWVRRNWCARSATLLKHVLKWKIIFFASMKLHQTSTQR